MQSLKLRPYQDIAVKFLLDNQRAALWAVPGMGKTSTVLTVIEILKLAGSRLFPVLIIAPKAVCDMTWPDEVKKWEQFRDLKLVNIRGTAQQRNNAMHQPADIYCINFENVEWLVEVCGDNWPFRTVVVDEATKLKSFRYDGRKKEKPESGGKRAAALAKVARRAGRLIELTGTPAPNGLKDLWGQVWFLDYGGRLGTSYSAFLQRWFIQEAYTRQIIPRAGAETEIQQLLSDCTLAFRAEDWFDIQKPVVSRREVRLPDAALKLYRKMERDFFIKIQELQAEKRDATVTAQIALALSTKLLQIASGSVLDDEKVGHHLHDAKLDDLESLINELGGENLIVTYQFKHEAKMVQERFPQAKVFRGRAEERAWNDGKIPLMLLQPQSGGHGVNLQHGGRAMAFFSPFWNLELRAQVIDRIGPVRQMQSGYDRSVLVYDLAALNTLDTEVLDRVDGKKSVMDALMEARAHRGNP